jgi:hypothetical protein
MRRVPHGFNKDDARLCPFEVECLPLWGTLYAFLEMLDVFVFSNGLEPSRNLGDDPPVEEEV